MNSKINKVKELLKDKKVAIAFSGGADSTLLCHIAKEVSKDIIAITVDNNLFDDSFIENSKRIAKKLAIKQIILEEDFFKDNEILKNKPNRCYLCRNKMYTRIIEKAEEEGFDLVVDGNNISDLVLDRPGILVNYEKDILSPFIEARIESYEIINFLKENNIDYSKSTTCLATRIQNKITEEKIQKINDLEHIIYDNTDCEIVKVRESNGIYICEVDKISNLEDEDTFNLIQSLFNERLNEEVILKLREIKANDRIIFNQKEEFFVYQLPYKIDIEKTKKEFEGQIAQSNENTIILKENIAIVKTGLITAEKILKKEEFYKVLTKIRRKI